MSQLLDMKKALTNNLRRHYGSIITVVGACLLFIVILYVSSDRLTGTVTLLSNIADNKALSSSPPLTSFLGTSEEVAVGTATRWIYNLNDRERKVYSQQGEDGIIEYMLQNLGTTNKFYVEFGTQDATECNTRLLWEEQGFDGLLIDGDGKAPDSRVIRNHLVLESNIVDLFKRYNVPAQFDVLSVDIDSLDYWVATKILEAGYRPRILIMEINRNFERDEAFVMHRSMQKWGGPNGDTPRSVFGQSPLAATYLCNKFGYHAVYVEKIAVNIFCLQRAAVAEQIKRDTGIHVTEEDLLKFLPPYHMVFRRVGALHIESYEAFKVIKSTPDYWVQIGPNGDPIST